MLSFEERHRQDEALWTNFWFVIFIALSLLCFIVLCKSVSPFDWRKIKNPDADRIYFNLGMNIKATFDHKLKFERIKR